MTHPVGRLSDDHTARPPPARSRTARPRFTQSAIFSGIVSGNDAAPGLIRSTVTGPDYLTGGEFGVESSVLAMALCTTTGIVMLVMAVRRGRIVPPVWMQAG